MPHVSPARSLDDLYERLADDASDTAVSVILKLRGETCNVDCVYCYEKRKEAPGGKRITPADIAGLTSLFGTRPLAIELHGGEPLTIGTDAMAAILRQLAAQPTVVRVSMQTNGVALNDQWLDLFDRLLPALIIGISLDGDQQGNRWRVGYDGTPVYPHIARALELLARRGRRVGVICAVTPSVLGRAAEVLDHIAGFDAVNAVSFVPCLDAGVRRATATAAARIPASRQLQVASVNASTGPAWATSPAEYADFVLTAGQHWVTSGLHAQVKLEPIVSSIRRLKGLQTQFCHFSGLKCDHVFTLYPGGRFGSCDELPWPAAQLPSGLNSQETLVGAQRQLPVLTAGKALMDKCASCSYRSTCGGGCVATRLRLADTGDDHSYCDYRMRLIDGVAGLLATPGEPSAPWCRSLTWRPRHPNVMPDVDGFLACWDTPPAVPAPATLAVSAFGNINTVGLPGVHEADDLYPTHPQWQQAIEPGVWPLVDVLTEAWAAVTYDSCAGHDYRNITPVARRVGLLPRTRDEYAQLAAALCQVVHCAPGRLPIAVTLHIGRTELQCAATGTSRPVLDLSLDKAEGCSWPDYFSSIEQATATVSGLIADVDTPTAVCGCARAMSSSRQG